MAKKLKMDWSKITLGSVIAFAAGWFVFGLTGAVILAIVVLILMGMLKYN